MVDLFVNKFIGKFVKTQVYYFFNQLLLIKGLRAKRFLFWGIFSVSFIFSQKGQNGLRVYSFTWVEFLKTIDGPVI